MAFVSEDILCLPRSVYPSLELYCIPSHSSDNAASKTLQYSCALDLPRLHAGADLSIMECRSDPSPRGCRAESHAFRYSPPEAIMVFNVIIHIPFLTSPYSLIVHRRTLLAHLLPADSPMSKPDPIPWPDWGPENTRLFSTDNMPNYLITTTSGQHYAQISIDSEESPITVLDFNPYNVRRMAGCSQISSPDALVQPITERNKFSESGVFVDEVWTSLPYVLCESKRSFRYDAVLMDQERIL
jgi:hypothetical protein